MATSETTRGYGPAIKLFGRTISVASEQQVEELRDGGTELRMMTARSWIKNKELQDSCKEAKPQDAIPAPHHTLATGDNTCAPKDTSKNTHHQLLPATEHRHPETKNGIPPPTTRTKALPCPRCSSQDTKFCYYNNYNINQPRYLCKDCRRYWTVGGATRDVPPAAAGSRKRNTTGRQYSSSTYDHHSDSDSTEFTAEGPSSCSTEPTLTEPISTSSSATATTGTDMWSYGSSSEGRVAAVQGAPAGPFPWAPRWNNMNATVMADSCVCTSGMVYRQMGGGISSNNTSTAASRSLGLFAWSQMVPIMTTAVFAVPVAPVVCNPSFQTSFGLWNSTPWLPPAYGGQFSGNLSCTSRVEECTAESVTMCVRKKPRVVRDP